jgi:hypothetical protein
MTLLFSRLKKKRKGFANAANASDPDILLLKIAVVVMKDQ